MNNLRPRIMPSLLLNDGRLIKTREFKDPKYIGDPINAVKIFNEKKVDELIIFDVSAWQLGGPKAALLEKISCEARMPLCYGGGIDSATQAAALIKLGFEKVSLSRHAILSPNLLKEIANCIGSQSTVVTLDVRRRRTSSEWDIYIENGKTKVAEPLPAVLDRCQAAGVGEFIINSIDRDGLMSGYDLALGKMVANQVKTPITMLGGAGSLSDMRALTTELGTVGAAAGSMFVFKGVHRAVLLTYGKPEFKLGQNANPGR